MQFTPANACAFNNELQSFLNEFSEYIETALNDLDNLDLKIRKN